MRILDGLKTWAHGASGALAMAGKKNPWGGGSSDGPRADKPDGGDGPRNPWLPGGGSGGGKRGNIEDIFKNRGPEGPRRGGGGGANFRMPERPGGGSWAPIIVVVLLVGWVLLSSVHFIQPREQAVVTRFGGAYVDTFQPGTNWSWPYPISQVTATDVSEIRSEIGRAHV